ncbi:type II toxin-antitoxin system VapC family toxin [Pusillimonas sp. ANT_WB101]|uniref:type II toxin-antitoxin system VapC family toxin n=1 Tax=Pusillimonas sp. ANT_WB101 TaxID=2597356 RepID=UPI0011EC2928|nr:type II toxin-antitoxin system VapC family toxin [Pusillimonas sp. ANT_WB101]KAA0890799.1 type II toxin-antitoxin system VapC family toxin [Pusillimonas sp. ANT_WB101]
MIVLDTNVLSELLRPAPDERPLSWFAAQSRSVLFTTTVTRAELLYGAQLLSEGQRKTMLLDAIGKIFSLDMAGQVLDFDRDAADHYAKIAAARKNCGKPISQFDAMIAAITKSRGARLATRNVRDFCACGIEVIDPWG